MSFDGSGYYILALDLVRTAKGSSNSEAMLRTAISRAYYAAFWKARSYLHDKEHDRNIPDGPDAHFYIRDKFRSSPDPAQQEIGKGLTNLRKARNRADYEENYPNMEINVPWFVAQAGTIIAAIEAL